MPRPDSAPDTCATPVCSNVAHRARDSRAPFVVDPARLLRALLIELNVSAYNAIRLAFDYPTVGGPASTASPSTHALAHAPEVASHDARAKVEIAFVVSLLPVLLAEAPCDALRPCLYIGVRVNGSIVPGSGWLGAEETPAPEGGGQGQYAVTRGNAGLTLSGSLHVWLPVGVHQAELVVIGEDKVMLAEPSPTLQLEVLPSQKTPDAARRVQHLLDRPSEHTGPLCPSYEDSRSSEREGQRGVCASEKKRSEKLASWRAARTRKDIVNDGSVTHVLLEQGGQRGVCASEMNQRDKLAAWRAARTQTRAS